MKKHMLNTILPSFLLLLLLGGCGGEKVEVTVNEEGEPTRRLQITVENGEHVIIEDPFIEAIEALQSEIKVKRDHLLQNLKTLSPEERAEYGRFMKEKGKQLREMRKERKDYIRQKMQELNGTAVIPVDSFGNAIEQTQNYFDHLQSMSSESSEE